MVFQNQEIILVVQFFQLMVMASDIYEDESKFAMNRGEIHCSSFSYVVGRSDHKSRVVC